MQESLQEREEDLSNLIVTAFYIFKPSISIEYCFSPFIQHIENSFSQRGLIISESFSIFPSLDPICQSICAHNKFVPQFLVCERETSLRDDDISLRPAFLQQSMT